MTNPTADAAKPLPCPFCGGEAELEAVAAPLDRIRWSVGCKESLPYEVQTAECMGYQSLTSFATKREAIAAWNTRPQPAPPEGEPDFQEIAREIAGLCGKHYAPYPGFTPHPGYVADTVMQPLMALLRDRLDLSARPKVEDAEVVAHVALLRMLGCVGGPLDHAAVRKAADLLERLAGDLIRSRSTVLDLINVCGTNEERDALKTNLSEREAELAISDAAHFYQRSRSWLRENDLNDAVERARIRHAARQQQKGSAEPTAREGE